MRHVVCVFASLWASCPGTTGSAEEPRSSVPAVVPPRLAIARDGAILIREGQKPERFGSLEDLVKAVPGLRGSFEVEVTSAADSPKRVTIEARKPRKNQPVQISAGDIQAIEFVRFLADASGLPVVYDSTDKLLAERMITVAATIERGNAALVKRILEANHVRVTESSSGPEGRILLVESMDAQSGPTEPKALPIIDVRGGELWHPNPDAARSDDAMPELPDRRTARGPQDGPASFAGMIVEDVPQILRAQIDLPEGRGVLVAELDEAAVKESRMLSVLKRFDVVTHVGDRGITSPAKLVDALNAVPRGTTFQFRVIRRGTTSILNAEKGR